MNYTSAAFRIIGLIIVVGAATAGYTMEPLSDEGRIQNLISHAQDCARRKDVKCLAKHLEDPDAIYIVNSDKQREIYPNLEFEAFNPNGSSLYVVSSSNLYSHKIFFTSKQTAEVVFYNKQKAAGSDSFEKMISTQDYLQCGVVNISGSWRLANSLCSYIYDGD